MQAGRVGGNHAAVAFQGLSCFLDRALAEQTFLNPGAAELGALDFRHRDR
jgi:hypothetical protein